MYEYRILLFYSLLIQLALIRNSRIYYENKKAIFVQCQFIQIQNIKMYIVLFFVVVVVVFLFSTILITRFMFFPFFFFFFFFFCFLFSLHTVIFLNILNVFSKNIRKMNLEFQKQYRIS